MPATTAFFDSAQSYELRHCYLTPLSIRASNYHDELEPNNLAWCYIRLALLPMTPPPPKLICHFSFLSPVDTTDCRHLNLPFHRTLNLMIQVRILPHITPDLL